MLQNMYFITDSFRAVTLVIKRHHHSRYRRRFNSIFQVNLVSWFHSFSSACCRTTLTDMCHGFFLQAGAVTVSKHKYWRKLEAPSSGLIPSSPVIRLLPAETELSLRRPSTTTPVP